MKKYIVKNCPCLMKIQDPAMPPDTLVINTIWLHDFCGIKYCFCKDCTDCLIKRGIEKLQEIQTMEVLAFPDFDLKQNAEIIMNQYLGKIAEYEDMFEIERV